MTLGNALRLVFASSSGARRCQSDFFRFTFELVSNRELRSKPISSIVLLLGPPVRRLKSVREGLNKPAGVDIRH